MEFGVRFRTASCCGFSGDCDRDFDFDFFRARPLPALPPPVLREHRGDYRQ